MQKELLTSNNLFYSSQKMGTGCFTNISLDSNSIFYQPKGESNMLRDAD